MQRPPLTAPAPLRPRPASRLAATASADATGTSSQPPVLKPHPLRASHVADSPTAPAGTLSAVTTIHVDKPASPGAGDKVRPLGEGGGGGRDADAEEELREIVASLVFQRSLLGSHREGEPDAATTTSSTPLPPPPPAAARASSRSSTSTSSSSSYLTRAPRTPSRGGGTRPRNGHAAVSSLRRKASHGGGGGGSPPSSLPEQGSMHPGDANLRERRHSPDKPDGRGGASTGGKAKRGTPPISYIGFDGKRRESCASRSRLPPPPPAYPNVTSHQGADESLVVPQSGIQSAEP